MQVPYDVIIAGAGLTGAVMAERFVSQLGLRVLVVDKRDHIGGNCYDEIDPITKIRYNLYGAHIFHTNSKQVWEYIHHFGKWIRYDHKVVSYHSQYGYLPIPVNLETLNRILNCNFNSKSDFEIWKANHPDEFGIQSDAKLHTFDFGVEKFGKTCFKALFENYSEKQWCKPINEIDKSVIDRIPILYSNEDRYFQDKYQAIPSEGYTNWFENLFKSIAHSCTVILNTDVEEVLKCLSSTQKPQHVVYTGRIDQIPALKNHSDLPELEYRSLKFEIKRYGAKCFRQTHFVVNYPEKTFSYTRIAEYKHLINNPKSSGSLCVLEYPSSTGEPYYPVPNKRNQDLYQKYLEIVDELDFGYKVHFIGRLAGYKYINMDQAIYNALEYFENNFIKK